MWPPTLSTPLSYTGVNAGIIIGVSDDAGMHSSRHVEKTPRDVYRQPGAIPAGITPEEMAVFS